MRDLASFETRPFTLTDEADATRVVRGRVDSPAGAERAVEPLPTVLVLHGFKGFMDWGFFPELSRRLAARGLVAVSFNRSGSGVGPDGESFTEREAFERCTFTREVEDVSSVLGFLEAAIPWADVRRRGIFGHSMGGGIALLHAATHGGYSAVATWAAISRVQRYDEATVAAWRERGFIEIQNARTGEVLRMGMDMLEDIEANADALDIRAACGRIVCPTLLLHGTADEAVPYDEATRLQAAFRPGVAELRILQGQGHTFGAVHPLRSVPPALDEALQSTLDHFVRHLAPRPV